MIAVIANKSNVYKGGIETIFTDLASLMAFHINLATYTMVFLIEDIEEAKILN